jgi:hypothetical protein
MTTGDVTSCRCHVSTLPHLLSLTALLLHNTTTTDTILLPSTMVPRARPSPGTIVYIHSGVYHGWIGRVDRYTAARVWLRFLEGRNGNKIHVPDGLIDPSNCFPLTASHPRATGFPELLRAPTARRRNSHPLRRAIVAVVIEHATASANFQLELTAVITALNASLHQHSTDAS